MLAHNQQFQQAIQQVKQGALLQSQRTFIKLVSQQPNDYCSLINLAALQLKLGQLQSCKKRLAQAIEVDPFHYIAYYNRFLCYYEMKDYIKAQQDILRCLSCLLVMKGKEHQNLKLLNRAVKYCESNTLAYIERGKIYHMRMKNNLAANDFTTAIELANNWVQAYYNRAMFYREIGKKQQCQQDIANYLKCQYKNNQYEGIILQGASVSMLREDTEIKEVIKQKVKQFQELRLAQQFPLDNITSPMNAMSPKSPRSPKSIKSTSNKQSIGNQHLNVYKKKSETNEISQELVGDDMIMGNLDANVMDVGNDSEQMKGVMSKSKLQTLWQSGQAPQQPNSMEQQQHINKYKYSIQQKSQNFTKSSKERGQIKIIQHLPSRKVEEQQLQDRKNSIDEEIMSRQIEKAVDNISSNSMSKNNELSRSIGSKLSTPTELSIEEIKLYSSLILEVVSAQVWNKKTQKQLCVKLQYCNQKHNTKQSKNLTWRQKFVYDLKYDYFNIDVALAQKDSIWSHGETIGKGDINILEKGQTRCMIINTNGHKSAIVHYKIVLQ